MQNLKDNTCAGVSTYQFNLQSMGKINKFHRKCAGAWNCKELLFNKVAANQACIFTKIRLQHRCFLVKLVKIFRTTVLKNICQQIFLK